MEPIFRRLSESCWGYDAGFVARVLSMAGQNVGKLATAAVERGEGILRLAPTWVPRAFLQPGRRLRLADEDLYALGAHRGGIDERWLSSTIAADNPGAPPDEGLSYVVDGAERFTLRDAVEALGARIVGE